MVQEETYLLMREHVAERYRMNWTKSLKDAYALDPDFLTVDPASIDFLVSNRETLLELFADPATFDDLVDLFVELSLEFSYNSNQFIRVSNSNRDRMVEIYRSYLRGMERLVAQERSTESLSRSMEALVRDHFVELRRYLDDFSAEGLRSGSQDNVFLASVVCREYSPELQLSILGIDPSELLEPILDIGCGKSGQLVRFLRGLGLAAFGADRVVEASDYLMKADWLDLPMEPGSWGTVISHMGFSNHFIFQHLYRYGSPEDYARQYAAILASLKVGGSFWYTPGLSFVESYLPPQQFSVVRRRVSLPSAIGDTPAPSAAGNLPYSTQVTKK
ncbi:MAG TPA: class I SAM-dependent methyltransferase [Chloroflexota bacterium]|nr:class I SAM-dependent methyltransferase [Chloroflexota bacterium]